VTIVHVPSFGLEPPHNPYSSSPTVEESSCTQTISCERMLRVNPLLFDLPYLIYNFSMLILANPACFILEHAALPPSLILRIGTNHQERIVI